MQSIVLPVSIGEALDKLSILEIKLEKITDTRREDVKKEYDAIYDLLSKYFTEDCRFHYKILKETNLEIWNDQDIFRDSTSEEEKINLCKKIIKENDRRFRIKSKLNTLFSSSLKEQKGYVKRKAFYIGHMGMGDILTSVGLVRFLATEYEEVQVACLKRNSKNFKLIYKDDPSIFCYEIECESEINSSFYETIKEYDVYTSGGYNKNKHVYEIPFSFYDDAGVDREKFYSYFHFSHPPESDELYESLKNKKYVFIHNTASTGTTFDKEVVEEMLEHSEVLYINPNVNMYEKEDKSYEIAEKFVGHPLLWYKRIIQNADSLFLSDSSFFCYTIHLELKAQNVFYFPRQGEDYSYLIDSSRKKTKFHKIIC